MSNRIECFGRCWTRRQCLMAVGGLSVATVALASGIVLLRRGGEKSEYETHRDEITKYQALSRPKMVELLGAENYDRCCAAMLREYDEFAANLPAIEGESNRDTFFASAPFMLSLYRTLLAEFAVDQPTALDILGQITSYKVRQDWENRTITRFVMSHAADSEFFRKMVLKGFEWEAGEEYGWAAEFPDSDAYIAVDITQCGLVRWFSEQGAPEIAPVACEGDFIWAEFMSGLELRRTMTLADGDDVCDFRYVKVQA